MSYNTNNPEMFSSGINFIPPYMQGKNDFGEIGTQSHKNICLEAKEGDLEAAGWIPPPFCWKLSFQINVPNMPFLEANFPDNTFL